MLREVTPAQSLLLDQLDANDRRPSKVLAAAAERAGLEEYVADQEADHAAKIAARRKEERERDESRALGLRKSKIMAIASRARLDVLPVRALRTCSAVTDRYSNVSVDLKAGETHRLPLEPAAVLVAKCDCELALSGSDLEAWESAGAAIASEDARGVA